MHYEYLCKTCGHFEIKQSIHDEALRVCPKCGGSIRRLISMPPRPIWKGNFRWMKGNYGKGDLV